MKETVFVNTTRGEAWSDREGSTYSFRAAVAGEEREFSLRFLEDVNGRSFDIDPDIQSMQISVGLIDAPPMGGSVRYQFGSGASTPTNTTAALWHNHNAAALKASIPVEVINLHGSPLAIDLPGGVGLVWQTAVTITPRENHLWPLSFVRVYTYELADGSGWMHELRMVQAPLVQTTAWVRALPPAPSVETIRDGGADQSNTYKWSEIQDLTVPATFRGTYSLRNPQSLARTDILSPDDDADSIAEQLARIYPDGTVKVTNPRDQVARIEWSGGYIGVDMPEIEVRVDEAPPGDPTFSLNFKLGRVYAALRDRETFDAQIEVKAVIRRADNSSKPVVLFRAPFAITRDQNWDGMSEAVTPLWLRPPSPVDYIPYTDDQVIIGESHYVATVGDGISGNITIDHNLDSEAISSVIVRENETPGVMVDPSTYIVSVDSKDSISIDFDEAIPAPNSLVVIITTAGPVSAFQAHTHTQEQIIGLVDSLENLAGRLNVLEEILPSTGPASDNTSTTGLIVQLPQTAEVLFTKTQPEWKEDGPDVSGLNTLRPPPMLPAVHSDTPVDPLPTPLPTPSAGVVWIADRHELIPVGGGIRSQWVEDDDPVASDGRYIYTARQSGATNSYYATAFERKLFALAINEKMFALNRTLDIQFGLQAQLFGATCQAQWVLSMQLGTFDAESTPSPIGLNLEFVEWSALVFEQVIILSPLLQAHSFGLRIHRAAVGFSLDQQLYGVWGGNNAAAPESANFAVRAVLDRFDTENRDNPKGYVAWRLIGALDEKGSISQNPQAIIS